MRLEVLFIPIVLVLAGCPRYDPAATAVNTPPAASPSPVAPGTEPGTVPETVPEPGDASDEPAMMVFEKTVSADGTYVVRYAPARGSIPLNEMFDLVVTVMDNGEPARPARDITIDIDGRMPQHHHGMNLIPVIKELEPGRFSVEGMLFHMPGYWEIHVDITRAGMTERAQFTVNLD